MSRLAIFHHAFLPAKWRVQPDKTVMALYFLACVADGAMMPFFALWAQQRAHISVTWIGTLLACYAGGELIATPLLGGIADRVGRRPVLIVSTLGVGIGFLVLAHLDGIFDIALCLIAIGVLECAFHPTIYTVIADTVEPEHLRVSYASTHIASGIGQIAGPALGAVLALLSLNAVFVGCGVSLLFAFLIVLLTMPETLPHSYSVNAQDEGDDDEGLKSLIPAFRDPRLASLLVWFAVIEIVGCWPEVVTPPYAHGAHALSASGVGALFTYAAIVGVALQWPVTKWSEKFSAFPLLMSAGIAVGGGFALLIIEPNMFTLYASATLLSLAQVLLGPLVPVTVNALAPTSARATYMAAVSTVQDIRDTAGPASGLYLYGLAPRLPWIVGLPIAVCAALAMAWTVKRSERLSDFKSNCTARD